MIPIPLSQNQELAAPELQFLFLIIFMVVIGKTAVFEPQPLLKDSARFVHSWELDHPVSTSLDFATVIFLDSKVVSLASSPSTWRTRSLYLCPPVTGWPSYTPRHRIPFPSPSATRRTTVEVHSNPPQHGDLISYYNDEQ
jgi:hypothetical protein